MPSTRRAADLFESRRPARWQALICEAVSAGLRVHRRCSAASGEPRWPLGEAAVWRKHRAVIMMYIIFRSENEAMRVASTAGRSEVIQRGLAKRVGKALVVHGAGEHECTDLRGECDERMLMRA